MSTESVILSNHLFLCHFLILLPSIFPSIRVFSSELAPCNRWSEYWSFSNIQGWFPLGLTGLIFRINRISSQSKGLSRVFSSTAIQRHHFFHAWPSLWSNSHICKWLLEKHSCDYTDLCWQSDVSAFLNTLSRFVIAFLPRSKCLLISWLQSPFTVILEPKKIKSITASMFSPSICHEVTEPDAMILVFWMLSFKPAFPLFSFTLIKRLFSSLLISAFRMVSSAYLRLLTFLLTILIPTCDSSSLALCTMYSAYKLNKRGDNIQPWCTPFPILNQSVVPCKVLTAAS